MRYYGPVGSIRGQELVDAMDPAERRRLDKLGILDEAIRRYDEMNARLQEYMSCHPDEAARIDMLIMSPDPHARMVGYDMLDDIRILVSRRRKGGHAGSPRGLDLGN